MLPRAVLSSVGPLPRSLGVARERLCAAVAQALETQREGDCQALFSDLVLTAGAGRQAINESIKQLQAAMRGGNINEVQSAQSGSGQRRPAQAELCPPQNTGKCCVAVLTPSSSEHDLIWKWGRCRCN